MFFTYLFRELRRRTRQAIVIALGLALGIGLTIAVTAASAGVTAAQGTVLHSLYGVGTDMTVTETAKAAGTGARSFSFSGPKVGTAAGTNSSTTSTDNLTLSPGTSAITAATLTKIKDVSGVTGAVGSLTLSDFNLSTTLKQTTTKKTVTTSGSGSTGGTSKRGAEGGAGGGGGGSQSFFQGGQASGGGSFSSTTVTGVNTTDLSLGPVSALALGSGRNLAAADADADVALVTETYASSNSLKVGSALTLGGKSFKIVGLVSGSTSSEVYIPLTVAQTLSSETGAVSTVYVSAGNSTEIDTVAAAIKKADSTATVTTSADLAKQVTGTLSSTASLANNLGRWLAILVLAAAFAVAGLLTVSAVGRRVREFGTLKALGWTSRRVVRQVMGEAIVTGLVGGALGIGIGVAGAFAIGKYSPALTASTGGVSGSTGNAGFGGGGGGGAEGGGGGGGFGRASAAQTVTVHLTAPIALNVLLLAVGLAVLGGLIAGALGGWRASALRPADALRKVA